MNASKNPCKDCNGAFVYNGRHYPLNTISCNLCDKRIQHKGYLERKRKYRPGEVITTIDDLMSREMVFWIDKVYSIAWIKQWSYASIANWLKKCCFREAVLNEKS